MFFLKHGVVLVKKLLNLQKVEKYLEITRTST